MQFKSAIKIRLQLDTEDAAALDGQSRILNWTYNYLLAKANELRQRYRENPDPEIAKTLYTERGLRNHLPGLKQEKPFLKAVHSSPLKNAALRLSESIRAYQSSRKGKPNSRKRGWPSFRSQRRKWFSLLYDEPGKGFKLSHNNLRLSFGCNEEGKRICISGTLEKPLSEFGSLRVLNLRITKEGKNYFAIFAVAKELPETKKIKKAIAIDPNHKNLGYGVSSSGEAIEIKNPYFLKNLQRRIDQLKSRRDKCKRKSKQIVLPDGRKIWLPSKRWKQFNSMLENVYRKRREQTKTFLYTIANRLYREYDLVAMGDYTPHGGRLNKGMRRAMNNESLIGRFKEVLSWVALRGGKHYQEWPERGSTKTCSSCRTENSESLSPDIRTWQCKFCHTHHIRDENAAINGLKLVVAKLKLPCSGRSDGISVLSRRAWRFDGLGMREFPRPGAIGGVVEKPMSTVVRKLNAGSCIPVPRFV